MTGDVDVSIIAVNWNTRDLLAQCLRSVEATGETRQELNVQTCVVDNASTDGSAGMVREHFPWVRLIANTENLGFARANNQALRQVAGRYIALLNSDTEVHTGALETLVAFMDAHPEAGACGPLLLNADGTLQPSCHPVLTPGREFWRLLFLERLWPRATYHQHLWDRETPREVEVIKGACLVLRREALDQVGLLDEQYFMYSEEMDLCHRLQQAGWQLYWVPQAKVTHYGEASSRQRAEAMYIELYRSKTQFHRKFGGERRAITFKALMTLAYLPRWLLIAAAALPVPRLRPRARTYRRLLRELPGM
ncbi:MAG: glycosyltransferase family 2 protein [Anaerolineales bacterium]|nr:glycosyltransferase family 2 protein [Anaerolineales bacterium]